MDLDCAICFETINNFKDKKTLACEHMYHKDCINQVQNNKCPLCKGDIVDEKIKAYENLYFSVCKQLRFVEIENEKLKKILEEDTVLKDINDHITKSIKENGYTEDIKKHYNIKKSLIPFHCKYCNYRTGRFGCLYNHINKDHYDKITLARTTNTPAFSFTFGNTGTFSFTSSSASTSTNTSAFSFGNGETSTSAGAPVFRF